MRASSWWVGLVAVLVAAGVGASPARADGLPVLGVDVGAVGVLDPAAGRYVTLPAGADTVVARVDPDGGRILGSRLLRGTATIPAVAYDGSASGLSADGRTLVLIQPRVAFPRARTTLTVLDARRLKPQRVVRLRGDFSFDAVSPRGETLYLIEYTSPADPTRYAVRAYDLEAGRMLAAPIVDPHEPDEDMRGLPLTRATSPDGRWAYTLYDGAGGTPFIHALDTSGRTARCIDLDALAGADLSVLRPRIVAGRDRLTVRNGLEPLAVVDAHSFRVSAPPPAPAATRPAEESGLASALVPAAISAALAVVAALAFALRRRRRRLAPAQ